MRPKIARAVKLFSTYCFIFGLLWASCDVFKPRTPEAPDGSAGTWVQPDTPEQVVENIRFAIAERKPQNYLRSFSQDFRFQPTTQALTDNPILWQNWSASEEEAFFNRLKAASENLSGHNLQLFNPQFNLISATRFEFSANYLLAFPHNRTDEGIPQEVQGRLIWQLEKSNSGLWAVTQWTDQSTATFATWSSLKAGMMR